jgi:hypothetical protein
MRTRNTYDVVKAMTGEVCPVGEAHIDNERYNNLKDMIDLTNELMQEIWDISRDADRAEFSISRAGKRAKKFLDEMKDYTS